MIHSMIHSIHRFSILARSETFTTIQLHCLAKALNKAAQGHWAYVLPKHYTDAHILLYIDCTIKYKHQLSYKTDAVLTLYTIQLPIVRFNCKLRNCIAVEKNANSLSIWKKLFLIWAHISLNWNYYSKNQNLKIQPIIDFHCLNFWSCKLQLTICMSIWYDWPRFKCFNCELSDYSNDYN